MGYSGQYSLRMGGSLLEYLDLDAVLCQFRGAGASKDKSELLVMALIW